ncbi:MAG: Ig-like domain-containing protein, partial [Lachnospiraceae bacterium]|nr:Ig-like domain-containing protein [Lachnospiraceae bacterium]
SDEAFARWEETYIDLSAIPMMMTVDAGYPDVDQFPASYQNALYSLKEKHPNWIFVRMDTGVDWNTAIVKEMGDKSLVPSSSSGSWQNGTYGQGWSYASEGILKYYMDPRNFLTDPAIFQFEQLTYNSSYHTTDAVQEVLKNSFMSSAIPGDSQTYAQAFTAIGEKTGVSPFHLASRVLQEQGKGTSQLISGKYSGYEGYYNYFNVGASGKTDKAVIESGLQKAKELGWDTRYKSLSGGASLIGANYILKGQDTLYLEKFNVSNGKHANFTHQYMQNIQAPASEASNIRKAYNNAGALENSFVFKIPVYNNMPASACTKPNTTDTITLDKTTVSSLEVDKTITLIPYVNGSKVDYISNMTFSSSNTSVATVDNAGKVTAISPGTATISCNRSGANTATCTVTVVKANPKVSTPTLSPYTYQEGLRLSDVSLPDGWKWVKENTEIAVGTYSYEAVYTPSDTEKYNTITKAISFTVTKAIPNCRMPEKLEAQAGSLLGDIALPDGFIWESNPEIELKEPGEYTLYVSYNPDENNYYTVEHIPLIVRVVGSTKPSGG